MESCDSIQAGKRVLKAVKKSRWRRDARVVSSGFSVDRYCGKRKSISEVRTGNVEYKRARRMVENSDLAEDSGGISIEKAELQVSSGDVEGSVMGVTSAGVSVTEEEIVSASRLSPACRTQ